MSIQKELARRGSDLPVYWAVQDYSVPVPDGGIPVIVNSREWYQLLNSASYYIDNMYQPDYHRKPEGQVVAPSAGLDRRLRNGIVTWESHGGNDGRRTWLPWTPSSAPKWSWKRRVDGP